MPVGSSPRQCANGGAVVVAVVAACGIPANELWGLLLGAGRYQPGTSQRIVGGPIDNQTSGPVARVEASVANDMVYQGVVRLRKKSAHGLSRS